MKYVLFAFVVIGCLASGFLVVDCLLGGKSAVQQAVIGVLAIPVVLIPHSLSCAFASLRSGSVSEVKSVVPPING